jgi:N-acetylornithine carbamoyltransferase
MRACAAAQSPCSDQLTTAVHILMNRFLDLADLPREQIKDLLGLASRLQQHPQPQALAGKVLGLLFLNPSLRTLASFQSAVMRLGGTAVVITPGQGTWQMETRVGAVMNGSAAEHVREAVPVLASYCDAIGIRMFAEHRSLEADLAETGFNMMAKLCDKPLVNMESAMSHPCQALADWHTMDELRVPERGKFVLSWANHPRALPLAVPSSTVHMAAMRGMDVVVLRPEGFALPEQIMDKARLAAKASGGAVHETSDRREALNGAHVIYAKEWGSPQHYGNAEAETALRASLGDWCVDDSWFKTTREDCHFMHCLPVRRNVAVADEVLDGPRSVVIREAFNRMVVQMAVLYRLLRG